ncbi:hypothetical protein SAMN05216391_11214 [Lachnospiraceae bacterium KHCPX20]|nr:hypothetical protein SAMN05216391_11214 [Lachnospiraceae bacterium KHCPX20]
MASSREQQRQTMDLQPRLCELVEILEFTHFFEHCTFDKTDYSERGKHMKKYIRVVVAVELVTVGAKQTPTL